MAKYSRTYTVILQPAQNQWFGYCLEIPECREQDKVKNKVYRRVKDAIRAYLQRCLSSNQPIPQTKFTVKQPRFDLREINYQTNELR